MLHLWPVAGPRDVSDRYIRSILVIGSCDGLRIHPPCAGRLGMRKRAGSSVHAQGTRLPEPTRSGGSTWGVRMHYLVGVQPTSPAMLFVRHLSNPLAPW